MIDPSFWAAGTRDDRARVHGDVHAVDRDNAGLLVDGNRGRSGSWCQCEEPMPWPVSGSSPPSFPTSPTPRAPPLAWRSATAASSARPIMCVERLDVVRVSYGTRSVSGSGKRTCSGATPRSRAAVNDSVAGTLAHLGRRAAQDVPCAFFSIAIEARLGVCMPLRSTQRPFPPRPSWPIASALARRHSAKTSCAGPRPWRTRRHPGARFAAGARADPCRVESRARP